MASSLALIQNYDSEDDDFNSTVENSSILPLPALPSFSVPKCISREPTTAPDPTGKIRSFAHEAGNWATFIAIPVNSNCLQDFVEYLTEVFSSLSVKKIEDFHISLTRVLILRHHWINDFVTSLRSISQSTASFPLAITNVTVYTNDDKTRTFLALKVSYGHSEIDQIVNKIDNLLSEYNLEKFYESRSYHVSILWAPGDVSLDMNVIAKNIQLSNIPTHTFKATNFFCKTGNKIFTFNLQF